MKVTLPWNLKSTNVAIILTYSLKEFTGTTPRTQVYSHTLILLSFWKSIARKYFKRKSCIHKCLFYCYFNRGKGNYLYTQQQRDGLICNRWKRFKMTINLLICLPASTLPIPAKLVSTPQPEWSHKLNQNRSLFNSKPPIAFRVNLKILDRPTRPYGGAPASSLTSSSTLTFPPAYWPPSFSKKGKVRWGVFALAVLSACNLLPQKHTSSLPSGFGAGLMASLPILPPHCFSIPHPSVLFCTALKTWHMPVWLSG